MGFAALLGIAISWSIERSTADAPLAQQSRIGLLAFGAISTALLGAAFYAYARQRRSERATRAALAALAGTIANVGHAICMIDAQNRIVLANAKVGELLGLPHDLVVPGRPVADITQWQREHDEFTAESLRSYDLALDRISIGGTFITERTRPNGMVLEMRVTRLEDGSQVRCWTDVTAAHRAAQEVNAARDAARAAEQTVAVALESAPHGVVLASSDARIELINPVARDLLGLPEELSRKGTDLRDIVRFQLERGDLDAVPVWAAQARAQLASSGGHWAVPAQDVPAIVERPTHDGRFIEIRTRILEDMRVLRTYTDVTARKSAERAIDEARAAAERALRSRTEFLSVVSHELRTPLNAILGFASVLKLEDSSGEQQSYLRTLIEAGELLLERVNDILDTTRLERGQLKLIDRPFALADTLRDVAGRACARAEAAGLAFSVVLDPGLPGNTLGDEGRLRQILLKLLDNAVKFTKQGGITFTARVASADAAQCRILFCVTDTGIAIAPSVRAQLFEPFSAGDSSSTRRFEGLGLGLALCRLLVDAMGGSISVTSEAGIGSSFQIDLPLRLAPETAAIGNSV